MILGRRGMLPRALFSLAVFLALAGALSLTSAAAQDSPEARFFPETGHFVRGDFLAYFDSHGGLDIFGYPLTEEFQEGGRLVQYFQRQRMELWPENPEPYRVQLALLGDLVLGPGSPPIPASQVPSPSDPQQRYFPETGHVVGFAFKDFFEGRGGLEVFGYPTTEEMVEAGLVVQRFQRARLEWHPENPQPHRAQLGLLGEEYVYQMGMVEKARTIPEGPGFWVLGPGGSSPDPSAVGLAPGGPSVPGKLVFQVASGAAIYTVNPDGTGLRLVGRGMDPALSPDGRLIAYVSWDYPSGLYLMNADGSDQRLVLEAQEIRGPAWSPDGSRIAFYQKYPGFYPRPDPSGRMAMVKEDLFKIEELDLASGRLTSRPSDQHSFSPTWSPDGQTVAFAGEQGIYLAASSGEPRLLPGTDARFASPAWSPDGRRIAYMWRQHDHWEIGLMAAEGGRGRLLTGSPPFAGRAANNVAPAWSPAGAQIAFLSDREGAWRIYVMDAEGGNQRRLLDVELNYQFAWERAVSWSR